MPDSAKPFGWERAALGVAPASLAAYLIASRQAPDTLARLPFFAAGVLVAAIAAFGAGAWLNRRIGWRASPGLRLPIFVLTVVVLGPVALFSSIGRGELVAPERYLGSRAAEHLPPGLDKTFREVRLVFGRFESFLVRHKCHYYAVGTPDASWYRAMRVVARLPARPGRSSAGRKNYLWRNRLDSPLGWGGSDCAEWGLPSTMTCLRSGQWRSDDYQHAYLVTFTDDGEQAVVYMDNGHGLERVVREAAIPTKREREGRHAHRPRKFDQDPGKNPFDALVALLERGADSPGLDVLVMKALDSNDVEGLTAYRDYSAGRAACGGHWPPGAPLKAARCDGVGSKQGHGRARGANQGLPQEALPRTRARARRVWVEGSEHRSRPGSVRRAAGARDEDLRIALERIGEPDALKPVRDDR